MPNRRQLESGEPARALYDRAELGVGESATRLELDGVSLAWEESGEGVPVACLHAAGHGARDFKLLQAESPQGCRLLLFDWPGHGRSGPDSRSFTVERCVGLLGSFLSGLGLRSAVLLGSEFGAAVALAFAIHHPRRVRGLVLCQPTGLLPSHPATRSISLAQILRRRTGIFLRKRPDDPAEREQLKVDRLESQHTLQRNQAALSILALEETLRSALAQALCPTLVALAAKNRNYPLKPFLRFLEPILSITPLEQPGRPKLAIFSGRFSPLWEEPARMARVLSEFAGATVPLDSHHHTWTLAAVDWPACGMNQWLCTHPGCHAAQSLPVEVNPNRKTGWR